MKNSVVILLLTISVTLFGQTTKLEPENSEWASPYTLDLPKDRKVERFLIPIPFAPQISYRGVEDIRFMPGWGNEKSNEYWTYAFLWYLDGIQKTDAKTVEKNLKAYYTGLLEINSVTQGVHSSKVKAKVKKVKTEAGDSKTFRGIIHMFDYMAIKPIFLHCIVHLKFCKRQNKTVVFYEISPKPYDDNIWHSLNQLWTSFRLDNDIVPMK